jgi:hypothetical protein
MEIKATQVNLDADAWRISNAILSLDCRLSILKEKKQYSGKQKKDEKKSL